MKEASKKFEAKINDLTTEMQEMKGAVQESYRSHGQDWLMMSFQVDLDKITIIININIK